MSTFVTNGFVLRSAGFRQNDRLYTLFTERRGKVEAVATSSRKILSKLSPHLVPFAKLELTIAVGRRYDKIAGVNIQQVFLKPPYHLPTVMLGTSFLEITDTLTVASEPEPKIYHNLETYLAELKDLPPESTEWRARARLLLGRYIYKLLKITGLAIQVTRCSACQGELAGPVIFSFTEHCFFHRSCLSPQINVFNLNNEDLSFLHTLASFSEPPDKELPQQLLAFLVDYVQGHAGRAIYTLKVLRSIL